jgi:glycosyltransferase involved in cell wall biosynthesis
MADIAVVIATYRRPHLIERALDSVARQTLRPREIIVVDDASGDTTGDVVQDWARRHAIDVHFIAARENGGAGVARNLAMVAATSSLIAFLDSDDEYAPDALERLAAPLAARPEAVVSFADALQIWNDGTPSAPMMRRCLTPGLDTRPIAPGLHRLNDPQSILLLTSMIPTCAALFRRSAAEAVGWMPAYRHGEDWIFWLKLSGQGDFLCQFVEVATVHRQGDNQTGAEHDARNAQLTLNAFLKLRDGHFGVALTPANRARLAAAIDEKTGHLRYHASRRGLAEYWRAIGSMEARATGGRWQHLRDDPKSLLRALRFSLP